MSDLVVDLGLLDNTDHALGVLFGEFKDASSIVSAYSEDIGAPVLVNALDEFASDWNAHRERLLASISNVRKLASEGHKEFKATDEKLARDQHLGGGAR